MRNGAILLAAFLGLAAGDDELGRALARIRAVEREGAGNGEATGAWKTVVARGPEAMLPALAAFDGAGPRAANWLRAAVDAIGEKALAAKRPLDAKGLEAFVADRGHDGAARRLAYDWLLRLDPSAPDRLLPGMLDDPGRELRRDAVARAVEAAQKRLKDGDKAAAADAFRKIFACAREPDQVNAIAKTLKDLGFGVDLRAHYGFIDRWLLVASFDNVGMKGFDVAYAPEKELDPKAPPAGKDGQPARIVEHTTADPHGVVDLNVVLGKEKGSIAYALASVESPSGGPVELRVATNNAVKVFLNGELGFFRNEYHHGMKMDQYLLRGALRKGRNDVLLKICQNEQKEDWAQKWSFQARLCDGLGGAIPFKVVTEPAPK